MTEKEQSAQLRWYHRNKHKIDREARKEYMREWRRKNGKKENARRRAKDPEHRRTVQRAWHATNPARRIFTAAKARAKKRGLEFTIQLSDILPLPTHCPVLGIELRKGQSSNDDRAYSIDRVDNSKGYVPGNVEVISRRANVLKRDASFEELRSLAAWTRSKETKPWVKDFREH